MAWVAIWMVVSDQIINRMVPLGYALLDFCHIVIDGFGATSTLVLALIAHRFWTMIAAALHLLTLMAHLSRASDLSMHPAAYMIMQVAWSWLVPPFLIFATWRHQQRLQQNGSDPSWRNSSRSSPLSKASH